MEFYDPRLRGMQFLAQDFAALFHAAASLVDQHIGEWATDTVVNATVIDRAAIALEKALRRDPELIWLVEFLPAAKEVVKIGFSTQYRGNSFYQAVVARGLSHITPVPFEKHLAPEIKGLVKTMAIETLREHEEEERAREKQRRQRGW